MKNLYFEDYGDFACAVADTYDELKHDDELNSVDIIAKYNDTKEIICELIAIGYGIAFIDEFGDTECNAYDDAFVISLLEDEIFCEPIKRKNKYLLVETEVAYILDNCSSKIISNIEADEVYEVEVGNRDDDDCDYNDRVEEFVVNGERVSKEEFDSYTSQFKHGEKPVTTSTTKFTYKINNKEVSKEEFHKEYEKFEEKYMDNIRNMILNYCTFITYVKNTRGFSHERFKDEVNDWKSRILCW